MRATEFTETSCPRTKAKECSCSKVKSITESKETVIAQCELEHSETVKGTILFIQAPGTDTLIKGQVTGLTPGDHGFHIHEFGDIRSQDGKSAGGHYNPDGFPHALPPEKKRHAGSFGNLISDPNGNVDTTFRDNTFSVTGQFNPVLGRSVVVHAKRDDGGQPTGNAGARIGFGVIGISKN